MNGVPGVGKPRGSALLGEPEETRSRAAGILVHPLRIPTRSLRRDCSVYIIGQQFLQVDRLGIYRAWLVNLAA